MSAPAILPFDTRAGFLAQLAAVLGRAQDTLDAFDSDFALFGLGSADTDVALRRFLQGGGRLRLAMHDAAHLERAAPRFLRLLRDYSHAVECRRTPRSLRQLTDSFCIADDLHIVRRFHSDHARGEAAFDAPQNVDMPHSRFIAIWTESLPGLHTGATGL
jgi:uncharacterized protein YjiS (DUF1127 family)